MCTSSVVQNSSHQVLGEKWISSMHFMVTKQNNHQKNGTANLRQITSNPGPLLPEQTLWFQLSWGNLIIMPYIMVMLKFPPQIFQLSLSLNQLRIQTPLRLNQLMMMKWIISWNSSIHYMMKIFWMLTSRCFKLDWYLPLLQNSIKYLLCCFIKTEEQMLQSQVACHIFLCLYQPRPLWNWLMETWDMPN